MCPLAPALTGASQTAKTFVVCDSSINLAAMTDLEDGDRARRVVDEIDDAIIAMSDAVPIRIARKLLRAARAGVGAQSPDLGYQFLAIGLRADRLKLLPRGRLDQEAI